MKTNTRSSTLHTVRWMALSIAALAAVACGGSDDDPTGSGTTPATGTVTLACGDTQLYSAVHDACGAMDAKATHDSAGPCDCFLGFAWDGASCVSVADCACEGADCDKLTQSLEDCEQEHAACDEPKTTQLSCGSTQLYAFEHDVCEAMDATATHDPELGPCDCFLGYAWDGDSCEGLGDCACAGEDCDKLFQSLEACESKHEACQPKKTFSCGSLERFTFQHDQCAAMDAEAVGDDNGEHCDCFLGYAWNGTECVGLGDCYCAGEDCDKLTESLEECEQAHVACE